jgi:hypothetical protein
MGVGLGSKDGFSPFQMMLEEMKKGEGNQEGVSRPTV